MRHFKKNTIKFRQQLQDSKEKMRQLQRKAPIHEIKIQDSNKKSSGLESLKTGLKGFNDENYTIFTSLIKGLEEKFETFQGALSLLVTAIFGKVCSPHATSRFHMGYKQNPNI